MESFSAGRRISSAENSWQGKFRESEQLFQISCVLLVCELFFCDFAILRAFAWSSFSTGSSHRTGWGVGRRLEFRGTIIPLNWSSRLSAVVHHMAARIEIWRGSPPLPHPCCLGRRRFGGRFGSHTPPEPIQRGSNACLERQRKKRVFFRCVSPIVGGAGGGSPGPRSKIPVRSPTNISVERLCYVITPVLEEKSHSTIGRSYPCDMAYFCSYATKREREANCS